MTDSPGREDGWEYKRLELQEKDLVEDGHALQHGRVLRDRSLELINDGWEPISASERMRTYRRALSPEAGS
jgi:hypothetical protein